MGIYRFLFLIPNPDGPKLGDSPKDGDRIVIKQQSLDFSEFPIRGHVYAEAARGGWKSESESRPSSLASFSFGELSL